MVRGGASSERNRGTRVEIERACIRPIRLGPPVRRGARRLRLGVAGGWRREGVLLTTDPAVRQYRLALFGPLLMVM